MRTEAGAAAQGAFPRDAELLAFVVLLSLVGSIGSSLYVPSLPALTADFGIPAAQAQASVSHFLFGLAFAQLLFGPVSDRHGRRIVLLVGLAIFLAGSLACGLAGQWPLFMLGRIAQGVGASVTSNAARAVLRDRLSGATLSRAAGYNGVALALGLSAAPIVGAALQKAAGWRAGFAFMGAYAAGVWIAAHRRLPETNLQPVDSLSVRAVAAHYRAVARHPGFWASVLCASFANAGLSIFYSLSPYLLQRQLKLSPLQYSLQMVALTAALIGGRLLNARLTRRLDWTGCLQLGNLAMAGAGVLLLALWAVQPQPLSLMLPVALFTVGAGFVFSNSVVGAMQPFASSAGMAGALYGFLQMGLSASVNLVFVRFAGEPIGALGACFLAFGLGGAALFAFVHRRIPAPATS